MYIFSKIPTSLLIGSEMDQYCSFKHIFKIYYHVQKSFDDNPTA